MWDLLGLDETDESVYRYDVRRPGRAPGQVARSTGLSEETVQASRKRLIAGGLLRDEQAGGVAPTPNGPAMIAERLRDELDSEYAHRRREVGLLQAEMTRLVNDQLLAGPHGSAPDIDRLPSSEAAAVRVHELLCIARNDVVHAEPDHAAEPGDFELMRPAKIKAAERGVNVRIIYPPTTLASPKIQHAVDDELRAGISVRTAAVPATKLTIVDHSVAVLVDRRGSRGDQTMILRDSLLVHALIQLFETTWTHARDAMVALPRPEHGDDRSAELNIDDHLLLQLLGEGMKDELIAKQLGVSVRTIRRKISGLLNRLNACSRFQAGVMACRRDWL